MKSDMRLPLTIITGYLGSGKTTLINRLLAEDHGLRLMVLVNDFGSVNVDADRIAAVGGDTLALTNGCVCCTISADLSDALNAALDRNPRPDRLILEASGISDPAAIAQDALAGREIAYGGIVALADGANLAGQLDDPDIGPQVLSQFAAADMTLLTRPDKEGEALIARLEGLEIRQPMIAPSDTLTSLLLDLPLVPNSMHLAPHPAYTRWHLEGTAPVSRAAMGECLAGRPAALYRLKGTILTDDGAYSVDAVGQYVEARRTQADRTVLVGVGLSARLKPAEIDAWWNGATSG